MTARLLDLGDLGSLADVLRLARAIGDPADLIEATGRLEEQGIADGTYLVSGPRIRDIFFRPSNGRATP
jgi:hypothetical protein